MKPLQFTIPVMPNKTVIVQEDILPHFYPHLHRHKEAQLVWIIKGTGSLVVETNVHAFRDNDIFLIAPNQAHIFKSVETGNDVHSLSVFYDPNAPLASLFQLPELAPINSFIEHSKGGLKIPQKSIKAVSDSMSLLKVKSEVELFTEFIHLLQLLSKIKVTPLSESISKSLSEGEGIRMGKVYDYVFYNFKTDISLEQVADIASLTPQAFCRYFKKHTGATFVTFLNEIRINEAKKKLVEGRFESITDLAYRCGFNSITNFNRVFKKLVGNSPKEYLIMYQKSLG